jgi:hypothetical protein
MTVFAIVRSFKPGCLLAVDVRSLRPWGSGL